MEEINYQLINAISTESNHTPHVYIDITGSLTAGTLLSQIVYWFSPTPTGESKIRIFKDGYGWIAKGRTDWREEIRISEYEYDGAIKTLKNLGFVETKLYKFNGGPMTHIRLVSHKLNQAITEWVRKKRESATEKEKPETYFMDNQNLILGKTQNQIEEIPEIEIGKNPNLLTEPTTETTYKEVEEALNSWNNLVEIGIRQVTKVTRGTKRYSSLVARLREYGIEDYKKAIDKIRNSDFLQGKHGGRPWKITFDWFVLPNNFPKVLEGNYDNETSLGDAQEYYKKKRDEEKQKKYEDFKRRFLAMKD